MHIENAIITIREHYQVKGSKPSREVIATVNLNGYITLDGIGEVIDALEKVYANDPVSMEITLNGGNTY